MLSIIIVNYNTREFLKKCLDNLSDIYAPLEIIVVDNGSTDGSAEMVKTHFPDVILIETENNGLAVGSNLGLQEATGDYILYLGTDAFPKKEVISGMLSYLEANLAVGIATPALLLEDGTLDMDAHRGFPTPWAALTHFSKLNKLFPKSKLFNQYFLGYLDFTKPHEIDLCISHFMLVRRCVFDDVDGWDADFFVYGEDVDFCYRVKQAGWKIMYLPQFEVLHLKGVSVGIRKETKTTNVASAVTKQHMRVHTTRAMKLFYEKHYVQIYPRLVTTAVLCGISLLEKMRSGIAKSD